jgi:hypothetical protein
MSRWEGDTSGKEGSVKQTETLSLKKGAPCQESSFVAEHWLTAILC